LEDQNSLEPHSHTKREKKEKPKHVALSKKRKKVGTLPGSLGLAIPPSLFKRSQAKKLGVGHKKAIADVSKGQIGHNEYQELSPEDKTDWQKSQKKIKHAMSVKKGRGPGSCQSPLALKGERNPLSLEPR